MIKRIIGVLRCFILKIRYRRKFNLKINNNFYKNYLSQFNNINIVDGIINIDEKVYMKKGARFGVNKGGTISIKSCYVNSNSICVSMGNIKIGEDVIIGPNVMIYDHDHMFNENGIVKGYYKVGKISIGNNVWIGAGAIILRDTVIGDNCIIGAGTTVKGSIPNNSIVTNERKMKIKKLEKRI